MKTQWASRCTLCKLAVPVGTDVFYSKETGVQHWECREHPQPTAEQIEIADRLGFVPAAVADTVRWTEQRPTEGDKTHAAGNGDTGEHR